jgi:hypothetical protein
MKENRAAIMKIAARLYVTAVRLLRAQLLGRRL